MIGYRLRRGPKWGAAVTCDDFKDMAVKVVYERDSDPTVDEYVTLQRRQPTEPWQTIGGATRDRKWAAR